MAVLVRPGPESYEYDFSYSRGKNMGRPVRFIEVLQ